MQIAFSRKSATLMPWSRKQPAGAKRCLKRVSLRSSMNRTQEDSNDYKYFKTNIIIKLTFTELCFLERIVTARQSFVSAGA